MTDSGVMDVVNLEHSVKGILINDKGEMCHSGLSIPTVENLQRAEQTGWKWIYKTDQSVASLQTA